MRNRKNDFQKVTGSTTGIFIQNQINNFADFAFTLKTIHNRLIKEGYIIKNGRIAPPPKTKELCYNRSANST